MIKGVKKLITRLINRKVGIDKAIISDILLWLFLLGWIAYGIYMLAVVLPARRGQTIALYFRNANEISRGAPVRLMGTDIGFVDNIRLEQDRVCLMIQTYPDALKIPSGSTFTILYTGLGGAKSIEVTLPPEALHPLSNGRPFYLIQEPYSMRDTLNASLESVRALQKGSENISDFFGKKKPVEELQYNIRETERASYTVIRSEKALNQGLQELQKQSHLYTQKGIDVLNGFNQGALALNRRINPQTLRRQFQTISRTLELAHEGLHREQGVVSAFDQHLAPWMLWTQRLNQRLIWLDSKMQTDLPPLWFQDFEQAQYNILQALSGADWFTQNWNPQTLSRTRLQIQQFNQQIQDWNQKAQQWQSPPVPARGGVMRLPLSGHMLAWQASFLENPIQDPVPLEKAEGANMKKSESASWVQPTGWLERGRQNLAIVWDAVCYLFDSKK